MILRSRWFFSLLIGFAALAVLAGLALHEPQLVGLAGILSQSGTPNPRNIEKLRLLPPTLLLAGAQAVLLALLDIICRQPISRMVLALFVSLSGKHRAAFLFGAGYLVIAVLTLDFGSMSLVKRFCVNAGLGNQAIVAKDYGKDYVLVRTLQQKTPETAHIFIRTRNDIKYLLNYDLYPRRFYFYPEAEAEIGNIPPEWWDRHRIGWVLDIDDQDPSRFILMERSVRHFVSE